MPEIHFIDDPTVMEMIATIIDLAGPNFTLPYDSSAQPADGVERNEEILTKFDFTAGVGFKGMALPNLSPSMGIVINTLLMILSPVFTAYGFLLPIFGIILGILEVLCCLMNPFCAVPAVTRLMKKWVPPLIALFPPIVAGTLLMSIIKLILALIYFVMTEIVPTIQLIIKNIIDGVEAAKQNNLSKVQAIEQKLRSILTDLINRLGILETAKPILEIIFIIIRLFAGMPCGSGSGPSMYPMHLATDIFTDFDPNVLDTSCCNDEQCPPEVASNPPSGIGLILPLTYGDAPPLWTWQMIPITGIPEILALRPYSQNLVNQLNPQLDEEIDMAVPIGAKYDAAHFRLKIIGRRGELICDPDAPLTDGSAIIPIAGIQRDSRVILTNVQLSQYVGVVNYCVLPNYHQLIARGIMGIACHPDIVRAKAAVRDRFPNLNSSFLENNPEMGDIRGNYLSSSQLVVDSLNNIRDLATRPMSVISQDVVLDPDDPNSPVVSGVDYTTGAIQQQQDRILDNLFALDTTLKDRMNLLITRISDKNKSTLDVDKNIVRAGASDKAIVSVTPRDATGTSIARALPNGVDISVEIFTDFGVLQNQQLNKDTGVITADLISPLAGDANITAKVNNEFVVDIGADSITETIGVRRVRFVADAVLPKRRVVSKPSATSKVRTDTSAERGPRKR